ncbi:MAG: hypothetical protein ABI867_34250 [Kofleriaceae bacterium]
MQRLLLLGLVCVAGVAAAQPTEPVPGDPPAQPPPDPAPPAPTPVPVPAPAAVPVPVQAPEPEPPRDDVNYEPSSVQLGGFLQTQFRSREDSNSTFDSDDTNGFRLARVRLTGLGQTRSGNLELSAYVEAELQPNFFLADGYATVARALPKHGRISLDGGQMRVPISRQNLLSDSRLAFVDKAQLATIAPERDLGARLTLDLPRPDKRRRKAFQLPGLRLVGGVFNGEGPNQVENINQRYFYVGRAELTLIGKERQLAESSFSGKFLTIAGSVGRNARSEGGRLDTVLYRGIDISGAYRGLSGSFEYLDVGHSQTQGGVDDPNTEDFHANGFTAQLCYLLPFKLPPHDQARFELGFRVEEIDRNDAIPIVQPADPGQSVRAITAVASYYLRMHTLKAQLAYTSFNELEDRTASGDNAAFANDQLLLQVTYRME